MAKAENINVSIEQAIHKAVCEVAENCRDEYGIYIKTINIGWFDVSTAGHPAMAVQDMDIETRTIWGGKS